MGIGRVRAGARVRDDRPGALSRLASLLTLLALFSRAALGAGPLAALGLLLVVAVVGRGHRAFGFPDHASLRRLVLPLAAAVVIPAGLYVALNMVKFGTPFSLPFDRQLVAILGGTHRAILKQNHGSLVGLQFVPTTLVQYFRPDAIAFRASFPFVAFPGPATIIGSARFDQVMPASSVLASMPMLSVLAVIGLVGVAWRIPVRRRPLAALRAPVLALFVDERRHAGFRLHREPVSRRLRAVARARSSGRSVRARLLDLGPPRSRRGAGGVDRGCPARRRVGLVLDRAEPGLGERLATADPGGEVPAG